MNIKLSSLAIVLAMTWVISSCSTNQQSVPTLTPSPPIALTFPGVVLYYPFDGDASDLSGNQNDGQVNGATLTSDRYGVPNSAYYFDGVDDYIAFDPAGLPSGDSPRTISAWMKVESFPPELFEGLGSRPSIIGWGVNDWDQLSEMQLVDGMLQFHTYSLINQSSSQLIELNQWYHLAVVYSDGTVFLYVNGAEEKREASHINTPVGMGRIGTWPEPPQPIESWTNLGYFHGVIDDIGVYSQALSGSQIESLYTGGE
jgi:hypothetical protein